MGSHKMRKEDGAEIYLNELELINSLIQRRKHAFMSRRHKEHPSKSKIPQHTNIS